MIKGGCYCGKIRFEISGDIRPVVYCHCTQCRKISGHYMAASEAKNSDLKLIGEPTWFSSSLGIERGFCPNCGTHLFWRDLSSDQISIEAGAFDADVKLVAREHIYVDQKADYYEICDGLPQSEAQKEDA